MTEVTKSTHGGPGRGGGRRKGSRNKALIAREIATKNAIDETLSRLTDEEIKRLTPLEIMLLAMHLLLTEGNLMNAVSVAALAAPYMHPKLSSVVHEQPLPSDLLPDPTPEPDADVPDLIE